MERYDGAGAPAFTQRCLDLARWLGTKPGNSAISTFQHLSFLFVSLRPCFRGRHKYVLSTMRFCGAFRSTPNRLRISGRLSMGQSILLSLLEYYYCRQPTRLFRSTVRVLVIHAPCEFSAQCTYAVLQRKGIKDGLDLGVTDHWDKLPVFALIYIFAG